MAAQSLRRWAVGHKVGGVATHGGGRLFRPHGAPAAQRLVGGRFREVQRRGKNLLLTLALPRAAGSGSVGLWSHLGMTGKWLRRPTGEAAPRWARVSLTLDGGATLHYCDLRLFGRFQVVDGARFAELPELATLGPDVLTDGIDARAFHARLQRLSLPIKVALLDQSLLAGVGNIQANEALFRARLDPRRPSRTLSRAEVARLARGIRASIQFTLGQFVADGVTADAADIRYVEESGTPNPFLVYGRAGERCPRCKRATIQRLVQAGRSTFWCPACILPA